MDNLGDGYLFSLSAIERGDFHFFMDACGLAELATFTATSSKNSVSFVSNFLASFATNKARVAMEAGAKGTLVANYNYAANDTTLITMSANEPSFNIVFM